ncbi:MAG: AMP-dependent synthetase, partial [Acidimicrobiales bacterium]|nr:AMP-dependent synthetase [Acidimicrobiales bacterium]
MTAEPIDYHEACARVCAPGTNFEMTPATVRGIDMLVFKNAPRNLAEMFSVAADRDTELIVYEDERWTSAQMMALAGRIANTLVDRFGVGKGDRVA